MWFFQGRWQGSPEEIGLFRSEASDHGQYAQRHLGKRERVKSGDLLSVARHVVELSGRVPSVVRAQAYAEVLHPRLIYIVSKAVRP